MSKSIRVFLAVGISQAIFLVLMAVYTYRGNRKEINMVTKVTIGRPQGDRNGTGDTTPVTTPRVTTTSKPLTPCPPKPPDLVGKIYIEKNETKIGNLTSIDPILQNNPDVMSGGTWKPRNCSARSRVLVIIPYRDRWEHLLRWLRHHLPILRRQQIEWRIVVTEQYGNGTFNKGRIMNAAYKEAKKQFQFDCVLFHDVDMLLEDDRNLYWCPDNPTHLSPALEKWNYTIPYKQLIGGVVVFPKQHYEKVNGYSNEYWGWGGEDDDMYDRIKAENLNVSRPSTEMGRYTMITHKSRAWVLPAHRMHKLLRSAKKRYPKDGLNNVQYKIISRANTKLYVHFVFDIGEWTPYDYKPIHFLVAITISLFWIAMMFGCVYCLAKVMLNYFDEEC